MTGKDMHDVAVIGAGVAGCCIARELSRYKLDTVVFEKGADICEGTSKANSGIVHAGFDAEPGSLKAQYNVRGSRRMEKLSKELDFPYRKNGSMVVGFNEKDLLTLKKLLEQGRTNGVEAGKNGMRIISGDEAKKMEPMLSDEVRYVLWVPQGAIVDPFLLTVAMAENACVNGVVFERNMSVENIVKLNVDGKSFYRLTIHNMKTQEMTVCEARAVINAAGVYADKFHNMVSEKKINIRARRGQYLLMDKKTKGFVNSTIFQCPSEKGKGVLVTPTAHGNLMIGPDAEFVDDKEDTETTAKGLSDVMSMAGITAGRIPEREVITSFSGLRAHEDGGDFIIGECEDAEGFFDAAGIESPGLSSAPAIGERLAELASEYLGAKANESFDGHRKGIPCFAQATDEEKEVLIKADPLYANVICRCEMVTEGEIVEAIRRPVGAVTLDGIKRRVRAGMGRCQAGFCMPGQAQILARELKCDIGEITKNNVDSIILEGFTK